MLSTVSRAPVPLRRDATRASRARGDPLERCQRLQERSDLAFFSRCLFRLLVFGPTRPRDPSKHLGQVEQLQEHRGRSGVYDDECEQQTFIQLVIGTEPRDRLLDRPKVSNDGRISRGVLWERLSDLLTTRRSAMTGCSRRSRSRSCTRADGVGPRRMKGNSTTFSR